MELRHQFTALVLTLGACCAAAAAEQARPTEDLYYNANALYNRHLYPLAISEYRKFLAAEPRHEKAPRARTGLALSLYSNGDYADAAPLLTEILGTLSGAEQEQVRVLLAQTMLTLGKLDDAARGFTEALGSHDAQQRQNALAGLIETLYRKEQWAAITPRCDEFLKTYSQALLAPRVQFQGGVAEFRLGKFAEAAQRLDPLGKQLPSSDPIGHQVRFLLGECARQAGNLDAAAGHYAAATEAKDGTFANQAQFRLGYVNLAAGKLAEATKYLSAFLAAAKDDPAAPQAQALLGQAWFRLRDMNRAESTLAPLIHGRDTDPEAALWMARVYAETKRERQAAELLSAVIAKGVDSSFLPAMLFDHGSILIAQKQYKEALVSLARLVTEAPDWEQAAEALNLKALCEHRTGALDASIATCNAFLAKFAAHANAGDVVFLRAENLLLTGHDDDALAGYQAFLKSYPTATQRPVALLRVCQIQHKRQEWDAALATAGQIPAQQRQGDTFRQYAFVVGDCRFARSEWDAAIGEFNTFLRANPPEPNADAATLKLGLAFARKGDSNNARRTLDQFIKAFKDSAHMPIALVELGRLLYEAKDADQARKLFELADALELPPALRAQTLYYLGWLDQQAAQPKRAEERFAALVNKHPTSTFVHDARLQLAGLLVERKAFAEAVPLLDAVRKEAKDLQPDHVAFLLGVAHARQDQNQPARAAFEQVTADAKSDLRDRAFYELAWCHRREGNTAAARQCYASLLQAYAKSDLAPRAAFELAEIEFDAGETDAAARRLATIPTSVEPELREKILYRQGWCNVAIANQLEAAKSFEALLGAFPKTAFLAAASHQAGEARLALKEYEPARKHFERAVAANAPDTHERSLLRLGETQALTSQWRPSEDSFNTFIGRYGKSEWINRAYLGRGWARENQSQHAQAIEDYRHVLAAHGTDETAVRCQFQLGECLFAMQKYDEAVTELMKVTTGYGFPNWAAKAVLEAGRCLEKQGNIPLAREQFESVVRDYPDSDAAVLARERLAALKTNP